MTAASIAVTNAGIRAFKKWDYFPHYVTAQLKGKWCDKLNALQGQKNTCWASGLNGFESVEWAVRAGLDVADSYF